MNSRERLFLGKQAAALFRLIPNVLCQLIVLCEGGPQRIQRSVQASLDLAEIPQLIAEQQQIFTQIFHGLGKCRDGIFNCLRQLFDLSSQFPEQGIVRLDLPIQLAAVGNNTAALQCLSRYALVDGGALFQTALSMAAVVDAAVVTGQLQTAVRCRGPRLAPDDQLFFAVPPLRDGVLPAVPGAFWVFVHPYISMRLRGGRRRVHLLFADFVGVLLLPALDLCGLELRGGKAPFFAVFDAEIFFLGLVLDGNAMRLSGFPNADEAAQVLDAGGVMVGDAGTIDAGGMVRVAISPNTAIVNESQATHIEKRKAIYVRGAFPLVMSPATAQALGIKQLRYLGEYLDFAGGNSPVTVKKASAYAIENLPLASTSTDGNRLPWGDNMALVPIGLLALLALMATLVSLLLARTQAQRDMATMVAVGAPPRFLRRYGLTQAAVILLAGAPVGVVSGVALGWLPVAWNRRIGVDGHWLETVPIWGLQAALAFGVVATGLLVAWLVTKPPRNLTRRSLD